MLHHTFMHCRGIGATLEKRLWDKGIVTWDQLLKLKEWPFTVSMNLEHAKEDLIQSKNHLKKRNWAFFFDNIPEKHHWRLFPHVKRIVYLDVEASSGGLESEISVVSTCDGKKVNVFVNYQNLIELPKHLKKFDMIVTFNGGSFDIPILKNYISEDYFPKYHLDLRTVMQSLGYQEGLKKLETIFQIQRSEELNDLDGFIAVKLWEIYRNGDDRALPILIKYNLEDCVNLVYLCKLAYNKKIKETPFADEQIKINLGSIQPKQSYHIDFNYLNRVLKRFRYRKNNKSKSITVVENAVNQ